MIDEPTYRYLSSAQPVIRKGLRGGQDLILYEVMSSLNHSLDPNTFKGIWLPFASSPSSATLLHYLLEETVHINKQPVDSLNLLIPPRFCSTVYFGTPTIVDGHALFPEDLPEIMGQRSDWDKEFERLVVRTICKACVEAGYDRIVCGLGSGDIRPPERITDMGGGKVACYKDFGDFQDWVIVRELQHTQGDGDEDTETG